MGQICPLFAANKEAATLPLAPYEMNGGVNLSFDVLLVSLDSSFTY